MSSPYTALISWGERECFRVVSPTGSESLYHQTCLSLHVSGSLSECVDDMHMRYDRMV